MFTRWLISESRLLTLRSRFRAVLKVNYVLMRCLHSALQRRTLCGAVKVSLSAAWLSWGRGGTACPFVMPSGWSSKQQSRGDVQAAYEQTNTSRKELDLYSFPTIPTFNPGGSLKGRSSAEESHSKSKKLYADFLLTGVRYTTNH